MLVERREARFERLHEAQAGVFHQRKRGHAQLGDRDTVDLTHLRGGQDFHRDAPSHSASRRFKLDRSPMAMMKSPASTLTSDAGLNINGRSTFFKPTRTTPRSNRVRISRIGRPANDDPLATVNSSICKLSEASRRSPALPATWSRNATTLRRSMAWAIRLPL